MNQSIQSINQNILIDNTLKYRVATKTVTGQELRGVWQYLEYANGSF